MDQLTQKQRLFVEAFVGDVTEAMQVAGYQGHANELQRRGKELLGTPLVAQAIKEKSKYLAKLNKTIADAEEIKEFWTGLMRNKDPHHLPERDDMGIIKPRENVPLQQRIKAAELLGKSEQMFVDKLQIEGSITVTDIITKAGEVDDDDLEAIEAEYEQLYNKKEKKQEATPVQALPSPESDDEGSVSGSDGVDSFF